MSEYNFSNKELFTFFLVNFGLTIGMGIVMGFAYTKYNYNVDSFAVVQMYYPTISVITALLLNKEKHKKLPMKFYGAYLFFTITSVLFLLAEIFVFHKDSGMYMGIWIMIGSITSFLMVSFPDEKEKMYDLGLGFGKKVKSSIGYILLFFILYICVDILITIILGGVKEIITVFQSTKIIMESLFSLPILFLINFIKYLGEEYGWRYFLQTALQERLGKRKGVLLVGFIWGIWHLPLDLFYYSPSAPFYSIINHIIGCTGSAIFLGFVYMKTKNIWTVSIIHFLNNSFVPIIKINTGGNVVSIEKLLFVYLICICVIYLPFLFTKEYRKTKTKVPNYTY